MPLENQRLCTENRTANLITQLFLRHNLYPCMFVINCEDERLFSKLKLWKNHLRNTMSQHRLASLAVLAFENELLKTLDFSDIFSDFAELKCRRKDL